MTIPETFGRGRERIIASFPAVDVLSGLGVQSFFGARSNESGNEAYILTDRIIYSGSIATRRSSAGTVNMVFESTSFNKSQTVKGTANFSCGTGGTTSQNIKAQLFAFDGSSEIELSSEITSIAFLSNTDGMHLLELPLNEKIIKKGWTLRLKVALVSGGSSADIGHDPRGRTTGTFVGTVGSNIATTVMQLDLPFKIPL